MAQTTDKPDKPQAIPPTPAATPTTPDDHFSAFKDHFNKAPKEEQEKFLRALKDDERLDFAKKMGWGQSTGELKSAPATGTIPWMKEKAYSILNWSANQLPTVGGVAGGVGGGILGELIDPAGGGVPGSVIGAGAGGALGEGARRGILHADGYDKFEDPSTKKPAYIAKEMVKEGAGQAAGEASGQLLGKWLRPTLERSVAKLYYAGKLNYGDPLGKGEVEHVINDLVSNEKAGTHRATTVRDLLDVVNQTKKDIGNEVDTQMLLPITQNGRLVNLGQAHANSAPIVTAINAHLTQDPSVIKMAQLNPAGKEAAYLAHVRKEALNFSSTPWTYTELTDRRIKLNNELRALYDLPKGERRVYLLDHPDLAYKQAEANAIRDVVYPIMDQLSGKPMGTTAQLQTKRGALMSIENQVTDHLSDLKTKTRQAKGAPPMEKVNISSYGTSAGKPGFAVHRLTGLVHTPNPEKIADKQVAGAFGNTTGSKVRKAITTPYGSKRLGNEILSMPLRMLVNPSLSTKPDQNVNPDEDAPEPQSSTVSRQELIQKAKGMNPAGQVAYTHTAVNPATGHKIGSHDGHKWFDLQTGQQLA